MNTRLTAAVLALALLATGCTTAVTGDALSKVDKNVVPVPEEPADWAISLIDPCKLLSAAVPPALTPSTAYQGKPHRCEVDVTKPDAGKVTVGLEVGAIFDHRDRTESAPTTARGLLVYQRLTDLQSATANPCSVYLPLSATMSIRVDSYADGNEREPERACATPREIIGGVAEHLARPEQVLRAAGPMLGKWDLCTLLSAALQRPVEKRGRMLETVDTCSTPLAGDKYVSLTVQSGDDPTKHLDASETVVELDGVPARQKQRADSCRLEWAQEPVPTARHANSVQVMSLDGSACEELPALANKIRAALSSEPRTPPAPARLGFPSGVPDEETDPACRIVDGPSPDTCRAPRAAVPVTGIDENMASADSPSGADTACAILAEGLRAATRQEPVLAVVDDILMTGCQARTPDFTLAVGLDVAPEESLESVPSYRCYGNSRWVDGTVAQRPAKLCEHHGSIITAVGGVTGRDFYIAVRGSAAATGIVKITSGLHHPIGVSDLRPAQDAEKVKIVDRMVEDVVRQYFAA